MKWKIFKHWPEMDKKIYQDFQILEMILEIKPKILMKWKIFKIWPEMNQKFYQDFQILEIFMEIKPKI
jgi:hypothetical protein